MERTARSTEAPATTVAIAGVTGFVGRALADALAARFRVIGIGRGTRPNARAIAEWRQCDLFSLKDAEDALTGVDVAVYLVHSMMPSATLTQGSFEDFDVLAADNFARAAARAGVRQIVYLGGLIPQVGDPAALSRHLSSRLFGAPVTNDTQSRESRGVKNGTDSKRGLRPSCSPSFAIMSRYVSTSGPPTS